MIGRFPAHHSNLPETRSDARYVVRPGILAHPTAANCLRTPSRSSLPLENMRHKATPVPGTTYFLSLGFASSMAAMVSFKAGTSRWMIFQISPSPRPR